MRMYQGRSLLHRHLVDQNQEEIERVHRRDRFWENLRVIIGTLVLVLVGYFLLVIAFAF